MSPELFTLLASITREWQDSNPDKIPPKAKSGRSVEHELIEWRHSLLTHPSIHTFDSETGATTWDGRVEDTATGVVTAWMMISKKHVPSLFQAYKFLLLEKKPHDDSYPRKAEVTEKTGMGDDLQMDNKKGVEQDEQQNDSEESLEEFVVVTPT